MIQESITLDGLTGAGKSIVGLLLAEALDAFYLETSVLYHAATWAIGSADINTNDTEFLTYALEEMEVALVDRPSRLVEDLDLLTEMSCSWEDIRVRFYDVVVNGEIVNPERLQELQKTRGIRWVIAWYDNLFKTLVDCAAIRPVLEAKTQQLAETYPVILGGDRVGPSFLRNAGTKYILTAPDTLRNLRIARMGRSVGAIWDRSDTLPETLQRDQEYKECFIRLQMSYIGAECFQGQSEDPRIHPVRDEYWEAEPHFDTDTRPFVLNTIMLPAYKVAKLIKPSAPIKFHRGNLHNSVMM